MQKAGKLLFRENTFSIISNKIRRLSGMEATYGGIPPAEVILFILMLAMLLVLWGTIMYKMGTKEK
jgi:hypothetical protein